MSNGELIQALHWYYKDDCQSAAMGILESPFERPAAKVLGISKEQARRDVEAFLPGGATERK